MNTLSGERKKLLHALERFLEVPMIFLGFVWLTLLIIEITWGLTTTLEYLSLGIWIIFIIDFILKLVLAPAKLSYLKKNWLTAISLVIPALRIVRFLRVLRLLRGVRLIRVVSSLNRTMRSLSRTMRRRGFGYVVLLSIVVIFGGAAGMLSLEKGHPGFENYGMALWWTSMRVITAGSDFFPITPEGRGLAFILAVYGYAVFGYVTAALATFFIGRDAEEKHAPIAGTQEIDELKKEVMKLSRLLTQDKKC